ncbi:hypothetical protein [Roseiconus lacunae]|uniref:Nucleotidyl transferase AbiEii/AbiGii toxin family protein n=1 Tax=Roseiconus lacunae TaxID=2605694 RepID=A0ABT7PFI1_9BACT|nr:hypothetical protein [Roseiconus lacunae]MDM4015242.1 hypothetical protein [Roseiconus lacunae]
MDDLLWPHFQPLWRDLVAASSSTNILVAGGYGLFLKQRWLSSSASLPTVVPIQNWLDTTPRVTKDVDLVLGLDLIKDASHQKSVVSALTQNGFEASDRQSEQRWKFLKRLSGNRLLIVEMHAQRPDPDLDGITATDKRVKHKPSLGGQGVHGRTNPEAVGSELHPFQFSLDDVKLVVPNPVTWSVMKLTATRDRWVSSQDLARNEESREFNRLQAAKHAQDVYRVIAMMTMEERDRASEIVESLNGTEAFDAAKQSWRNSFADSPIPVVLELSAKWQPGDETTIQKVLSSWFG